MGKHTILVCDFCDEGREDVQPIRFGRGLDKPYQRDVCADCRATLTVDQLLAAVQR